MGRRGQCGCFHDVLTAERPGPHCNFFGGAWVLNKSNLRSGAWEDKWEARPKESRWTPSLGLLQASPPCTEWDVWNSKFRLGTSLHCEHLWKVHSLAAPGECARHPIQTNKTQASPGPLQRPPPDGRRQRRTASQTRGGCSGWTVRPNSWMSCAATEVVSAPQPKSSAHLYPSSETFCPSRKSLPGKPHLPLIPRTIFSYKNPIIQRTDDSVKRRRTHKDLPGGARRPRGCGYRNSYNKNASCEAATPGFS